MQFLRGSISLNNVNFGTTGLLEANPNRISSSDGTTTSGGHSAREGHFGGSQEPIGQDSGISAAGFQAKNGIACRFQRSGSRRLLPESKGLSVRLLPWRTIPQEAR